MSQCREVCLGPGARRYTPTPAQSPQGPRPLQQDVELCDRRLLRRPAMCPTRRVPSGSWCARGGGVLRAVSTPAMTGRTWFTRGAKTQGRPEHSGRPQAARVRHRLAGATDSGDALHEVTERQRILVQCALVEVMGCSSRASLAVFAVEHELAHPATG